MTRKPYTTNRKSKFKVGQHVRFLRADSAIVEDTVRWCFWQEAKCQPYGEDLLYPALVLTNHSWCAESDVCDANDRTSLTRAQESLRNRGFKVEIAS
jgi:hypothetical protein